MTKLSEAMRKGCEISRPIEQIYVQWEDDGTCYACALGAVAVACGYNQDDYSEDRNIRAFVQNCIGVNLAEHVPAPEVVQEFGEFYSLHTVITDLNDGSGWTREQIADWLESIGF